MIKGGKEGSVRVPNCGVRVGTFTTYLSNLLNPEFGFGFGFGFGADESKIAHPDIDGVWAGLAVWG